MKKYKNLFFLFFLINFFFPSETRTETICVQVDDGQTGTITCSNNGTISSIDFDRYGTPIGTCENYFSNPICDCIPNDTNNWIGQNSVSVNSNDSICTNGDPCEGTSKHRYVQVTCSNIEGCTDSNAENFNSNADIDDGSCTYAPVFSNIPNQSGFEDTVFTLDLSTFASDNDNNISHYDLSIITGSSNILSSSIVGSIINLTPQPNYYGTVMVRVFVYDSNNFSANDTFTINFDSVNDIPVITLANGSTPIDLENGLYSTSISIQPNNLLTVLVLANDNIDNKNSLTYQLADNPPFGMTIASDISSEGIVSYSVPSESDDFNFSVVVTDDDNSTATLAVEINVSSTNIPPEISGINGPYTVDEDDAFTLNFSINGGTGTISLSNVQAIITGISNGNSTHINNPTIFSPSANNYTLNVDPDQDWNGNIDILLQVVNSQQNSDAETFTIIFNPINDIPVLDYQNNYNVSEDIGGTGFLYIYDVDTDNILNQIPDSYGNDFDISLSNNSDNKILSTLTSTQNTTHNNNNVRRFGFLFTNDLQHWNGIEAFTATYTDGLISNSLSSTFNVTINQVNDSPIISVITSPQNLDEDSSKQIEITATDIDSDGTLNTQPFNLSNLSFSSSGNKLSCGHTSTDSNGSSSLTIIPDSDYNKTTIVTVTVNDGSGGSDQTTFTLTINALNDFPHIELIPDIIFDEDSFTDDQNTFNSNIYVYDIDSDQDLNENPYDYSIDMDCTTQNLSNEENIQFTYIESNTSNYSGTYDGLHFYKSIGYYTNTQDWFGQESFQVTCHDDHNATVQEDYNVIVSSVNDDPVLVFISNKTTEEDNQLTISIEASDIENDNLSYSASVNGNATTSFVSNSLIVNPNENYNGSVNVLVTVEDDNGGNDSQTFVLTITPVDDNPFAAVLTKETPEDVPLLIELDTSSDPTICNNAFSDNGSILCDCNNAQGGCDIEQETLIFTLEIDAQNGSVSTDGSSFTYTPAQDYFGTDSFTYTVADDGTNGTSALETSALVTIIVTSVNDAPVITEILDQTINEGGILEYQVVVEDVDDNDLAYNVLLNNYDFFNVPSIDTQTKILTASAQTHYNGSRTITLRVSDDESLFDIIAFALTVLPIDDIPYANEINDVTTTEDISVDIELNGSSNASVCNNTFSDNNSIACNCEEVSLVGSCDIEGENLTYSVETDPQNGSITAINGSIFTYLPAQDFTGSDSFTYLVIDDGTNGTTALEALPAEVFITVIEQNDEPVAYAQNVDTNEDVLLEIDIEGTDVDFDILTFEFVNQPTNGTVSFSNTRETKTVIYIPDQNYNGQDTFSYRVSDNFSSNEATVSIDIFAVDDFPIATDIDNATTNEDVSFSIELDAFTNDAAICLNSIDPNYPIQCDCSSPSLTDEGGCDIEQETLTYSISVDPLYGTLTQNESLVTYTPNTNYNGADTFTYVVTDDGTNGTEPLSSSGIVSIIINPIDDTPIVAEKEVTLNEDEINFEIELDGSSNISVCNSSFSNNDSILCDCSEGTLEGSCDIEQETLTYEIVSNPSFGTATLSGSKIFYSPNTNIWGEADFFNYRAIDDDDTGNNGSLISQTETVTLNINYINDSPITTDFSTTVTEDCDDEIIQLYDGSDCIDPPLQNTDSVLCECDNPVGVCDIDDNNSELFCYVITQPENGLLKKQDDSLIISEIGGTQLKYVPNPDFYGADEFTYNCCDNESPNPACSNHSTVSVSIGDVNDQPIVACSSNSFVDSDICDSIISLHDIQLDNTNPSNIIYNLLYEDCSADPPQTDNSECDNFEGISVEQIRTSGNTANNNICLNTNNWYDNDCVDNDDATYIFGIAVDNRLDDKITFDNGDYIKGGEWQYKLSNSNTWTEFEFIDNQTNDCDYILLDKEDKIRFFPYDNQNSELNNNIKPSIVFYAWDQNPVQQQTQPGDCVLKSLFADNSGSSCNIPTPISEKALKAEWEIKSVNDYPITNINNLENSLVYINILDSDITVTNENDQLKISILEDGIKQSESRVLSLPIIDPLNSNNPLFVFTDLEGPTIFSYDQSDNNGLIAISDNSDPQNQPFPTQLDFNTIDDMNGITDITLTVSDGQYDQSFTLTIEVTQVNDPIDPFTIDDGIKDYTAGNVSLNTQSMFITVGNNDYIKYPEYFPIQFMDPTIYTVADLEEHLISTQNNKPKKPDKLYFIWENNKDYSKDKDSNPLYNSSDNLYTVYYRLELKDNMDKIFVVKDSITTDLDEYDITDDEAKVSIELFKSDSIDKKFKNYQYDDNPCSVNIPYNDPEHLDITGSTPYKWRITAQNYTEDETNNEVYCTQGFSNDEYYIDLQYPFFTYNFVLNDIYIDYFDLYLKPNEPISYGPGQQLYIRYNESSILWDEQIDLVDLTLPNEEIYFITNTIDQFGLVDFTSILIDHVGNYNIERKETSINTTTPGSLRSYNSPSDVAMVSVTNVSNEGNIIIHEELARNYTIDENCLSDIIVVKSSENIAYLIKFNINNFYSFEYNDLDNIIIYKMNQGNNIEYLETFYDNDFIYSYVSGNGKFGLMYNESISSNDEIPKQFSILNCYPNPFNPHVNIDYVIEYASKININIYDLTGKLIKSILEGYKLQGKHSVTWNGIDMQGNKVSSGIYLVKMQYGKNDLFQKITLLK